MEDFDRDRAIVPKVVGELDRRHAALPELPLDAVSLAQDRLQAIPRPMRRVRRRYVFRESVQ